MAEIVVGAGGWAYFTLPSDMDPLEWYAKAFSFVEVNYTFYEYPSMRMVASWRSRVPGSFEFSVRCHSDVTHKYTFKLNENSLKALKYIFDVCRVLRSELLVFETPSRFKPTLENFKLAEKVFEIVASEGIVAVWEPRGSEWKEEEARSKIAELVDRYDVAHCVDFSKGEEPAAVGSVAYSRLFGRGEHNIYQFTDEEIKEICSLANKVGAKAKKVYIAAHTVKMYVDAARIKQYVEKGEMLPVTKGRGVEAVVEALMPDISFPITKEELIKWHGWKVIDWRDGCRVRLAEIFKELPSMQYRSLKQLEESLRELRL